VDAAIVETSEVAVTDTVWAMETEERDAVATSDADPQRYVR
jgi:hypothetical protein